MGERVVFPVPETGEAELDPEFAVSIDLPNGMSNDNHPVSVLAYPQQVAVVANWEVPTLADLAGEENRPAWPRIEAMPEDGILLWILHGSIAVDYREVPEQGQWFEQSRYSFLGAQQDAARGVASQLQPFEASDWVDSAWETADAWGRLQPVAGRDGSRAELPQYLLIYGFAGKGGGSARTELDELVTSIEVAYG